MEFRILGPLEVLSDGRTLDLGGQKQRALLAMLLVEANRVVSNGRLIDALWEDEPPGTAQKALQVYVSQLRKVLSRDVLVTQAPGYALHVGSGELDAARFEALVGEAREAEPATAAAKLRDALVLWRGPALADFAYDRFARPEIVRLEELRLAALEERIEADLALGRHAQLVGEVEARVSEHPLRERLRGQLMLSLYRSGRQAEALEAYQAARRTLVEELGIEPSRALQDLERAILNQDPALDVAPRAAPEAGLPLEAQRPPAEPAPVPLPSQERKLASVVFADLVGFTELGEGDPERTRALLERFYDAMAQEVERTGGTVEKFVGDAVMAVFGVPAAHEDHAERALQAALAMRTRFQELFGDSIGLRIGVNTGEVVAGRAREGSSFVTGDAVNVAARLEQAAAPGDILVGSRTAAAVPGAFQFGDSATVQAKGKPKGIACRPLFGAVTVTRPPGIGVRRAFVGRERELELLRATYERMLDVGEPHVVTVMGNAGVGKTSLARELWEWLAAQAPEPLLRTGRCLAYGRGITYWPLGEVLKEHLAILESDPPETVRERLAEREMLGLTLGLEVAPELHPLAARERLHEAWVELLDELAASRPVAVLVDDLHWAEQPLLDLLDRLIHDVSGPLLLLATARPELLEGRPSWGAGHLNATQLWLEPLPPEDAARMLDHLLGAALPDRLRRLVLESAEGNPFFLEELVAALIDRGFLARDNGGWRSLSLPARLEVPDSVQSVLAARIDLLGPTEKAALQAASVIGKAFWAGPVFELLDSSEANLGVLVERDFIRRRPQSSIAGEREFVFKHALTRDIAYGSLPKARRARLHAAFAAWLESASGVGQRGEHAPLLAHHYAEAVKPEDLDLAWPGGGAEVDELREKAGVWLRRAAELASRRYALDEQIGLLERAVELESGPAEQVELWRGIARANLLKYDQAGFRSAMLRAIEATTEAEAAADLYSTLAFWDAFRWNHAEDRQLIENWIERALAQAAPESGARARALVARSYCRPDEAEASAREACTIAERLPDVELRSYAFHALADAVLATGRYDEAREWAERRLALLDEIADPDHVADIYWTAIPGYLGRGHFDDARRLAELHDRVTAELSPHQRLHGVAFLLEVEELAANWQRIRELTPRAEEAVEASTPCIHRPRSLAVCALAAACLGDEQEAQRLESAADSLGAEEYGRVVDTRLRLALVRGNPGQVEKLLAEAEAPPKTLIRSTKLAPVASRLDALAALRDRERIEADAPRWLQPKTYLEPFAFRALGIVREDASLVERAAGGFEAMGLGWHAAQTRALLPLKLPAAQRPRTSPPPGR